MTTLSEQKGIEALNSLTNKEKQKNTLMKRV